MKRLKIAKRTVAMMLVAVMICATAAFATSYESDYVDVPAGNKTYQVQSILYQDSTRTFRASTWVETKDSSRVPANYIGVKAELMSDDTGDAIEVTEWKYNSTTDYFMYAVTPKKTTSDRVYSRGQYKLYTGTTHKTDYAPETTYVGGARSIPTNILSTLNEDGTYPTTASGETYGSSILAEVVGAEPDLISAKGNDGTRGYVRNEDLNPDISCDTDYQEYLDELDANDWQIPLYDLQGTVIGAFEISKSEEIIPDADCPEAVKAALEAESNGLIQLSESKKKWIAEGLVNGDYPKNAAGQTYGSSGLALIAGHEPDLIAVRGIGNVRGYVRNEDLNPEINTAADYQEYLDTLDANDWQIPLYDQEGNVIGAFEISKSEELNLNATDIEEAKAAAEAAMSNDVIAAESIEEVKAGLETTTGEAFSTNVTTSADIVASRVAEKNLINGNYPTTADGKTYGPIGIIPHVHPDLVSVIATNGKKGYAKFEEFNPFLALLANPNTTPEELSYAKAHLDDYADILIPVYDLNGNVIGQFVSNATT